VTYGSVASHGVAVARQVGQTSQVFGAQQQSGVIMVQQT
jgi:hypothetical protein